MLTSLEGAFRTRHLELRSLRSGEAMRFERCTMLAEAFSWPSWMPEQARCCSKGYEGFREVMEEQRRYTSQKQLESWRETPQVKEVSEHKGRVPLNDPYAPQAAYPEAPEPEVPRCKVEETRPVPVPKRPDVPQSAPTSAGPRQGQESWSSQQQRLKKEQREARLAENLRPGKKIHGICLSALAA